MLGFIPSVLTLRPASISPNQAAVQTPKGAEDIDALNFHGSGNGAQQKKYLLWLGVGEKPPKLSWCSTVNHEWHLTTLDLAAQEFPPLQNWTLHCSKNTHRDDRHQLAGRGPRGSRCQLAGSGCTGLTPESNWIAAWWPWRAHALCIFRKGLREQQWPTSALLPWGIALCCRKAYFQSGSGSGWRQDLPACLSFLLSSFWSTHYWSDTVLGKRKDFFRALAFQQGGKEKELNRSLQNNVV